jgi:hypothetical protein
VKEQILQHIARPAYGHSKDGRDDLKQMLLSLSVCSDGLPLRLGVRDGKTSDSTETLMAIKEGVALRREQGDDSLLQHVRDAPAVISIGAKHRDCSGRVCRHGTISSISVCGSGTPGDFTQKSVAQFLAVCSMLKWSKHLTKSPCLALLALARVQRRIHNHFGLLERRQLMKVAQELEEPHIPRQIRFAEAAKHSQGRLE